MTILDSEPRVRRHSDGRDLTYKWDLGPTLDHYGHPATKVVSLSVSHHPDPKRFFATLRNLTVRDNCEAGMAMDYLRIYTLPVARYSAKARDAFAADAMAILRANCDKPDVAAYLTVDKVAA